MIQISVNRRPERLDVELYIYDKTDTGITYYHPAADSIVATFVGRAVEGEAQNIKPFGVFPEIVIRGIVQAFVLYGREEGFRSSDETFVKGKLEGTEKHLEDMRRLVFDDDQLKVQNSFSVIEGGPLRPGKS